MTNEMLLEQFRNALWGVAYDMEEAARKTDRRLSCVLTGLGYVLQDAMVGRLGPLETPCEYEAVREAVRESIMRNWHADVS
jgi:hypothetical protein